MNGLTLSKEQQVLLNLTAMSISDAPDSLVLNEEQLKDVDWKAVAIESRAQAILLATCDSATVYKDYIPKNVYDAWKNIAFAIYSSNFKVVQSQQEMTELIDGKFPYVILKGTASASYYKNHEFRALGDVDFLIDPKHQEQLERLFIDAGYVKSLGEHPNHVVFKKPESHLEMHFEVAGVPYGEKGEKVKEYLRDAVYNTEKKQHENSIFPAPLDKYHGLILLLHMQHHMLGEGFGLRHLCDWAVFVKKTSDQYFWENELIPLLKDIGLYVYTAVVTKVCAKYLHIACPDWAKQADDAVCDLIMDDIFQGGNFGRKEKGRATSGMLISERGKNGTKHGAVYNLSHTLHKAVLRTKCVKKCILLYPFVYFYKSVRFLFLCMIGKRTSVIKMMPEANRRREVYNKLKIFETENNGEKNGK